MGLGGGVHGRGYVTMEGESGSHGHQSQHAGGHWNVGGQRLSPRLGGSSARRCGGEDAPPPEL